MRTFVFFSVVLAAIAFSSAEDDGQYRPELYGSDDGKYRPSNDGRYYAPQITRFYNARPYVHSHNVNPYSAYPYSYPYYARNTVFAAHQPLYFKQAYNQYQPLLTPYVHYGDSNSIDQPIFAESSVAAVASASSASSATVRPVAVSTARPIVYSTPAPLIKKNLPSIPAYAVRYSNEKDAQIVRQGSDIDGNSYHYLYQTDNGINAEESGSIDTAGKASGTSARGFYEYVGDDGQKYRVDYTADENGFHPVGAHLV